MEYQENVLLVATLLPALTLLAGLLLGRRARGRLRQQCSDLQAELVRSRVETREQIKLVATMSSQQLTEQRTVGSLARSLPSLVEELTREKLDRNRLARLIHQMADAIFKPGQFLFYAARSGPRESRGRELRLVLHHGFDEIPERLEKIPFGEGKIGWVAAHGVEMLRADWDNPTRTGGQSVPNNDRVVQPDIIGALIGPVVRHNLDDENQVLAVMCIGHPGIRPQNERWMFQFLTGLGSIAMVNAEFRTQLLELANHDGLTGLLNKRFFTHELGKLLYESEQNAQPLAVFIFDIDHFKNYNDTNGHPAGDELLRRLAFLLRESVRPGDLCCRYGGEEFIVAMPETDGHAALQAAERIRRAIEETGFPHERKQPGEKLTISGGVAAFPMDGNDGAELIRHADVALYESKEAGRNRVCAYRGVEIGDAGNEVDLPAAESDPITAGS